MTRSPTLSLPYYRVELSPEAWREVGREAAGDFLVLQDVLELLAMQGTPYEESPGPHTVVVAGFEIVYLRDEEAALLTVLQVSRAQVQPGEAA